MRLRCFARVEASQSLRKRRSFSITKLGVEPTLLQHKVTFDCRHDHVQQRLCEHANAAEDRSQRNHLCHGFCDASQTNRVAQHRLQMKTHDWTSVCHGCKSSDRARHVHGFDERPRELANDVREDQLRGAADCNLRGHSMKQRTITRMLREHAAASHRTWPGTWCGFDCACAASACKFGLRSKCLHRRRRSCSNRLTHASYTTSPAWYRASWWSAAQSPAHQRTRKSHRSAMLDEVRINELKTLRIVDHSLRHEKMQLHERVLGMETGVYVCLMWCQTGKLHDAESNWNLKWKWWHKSLFRFMSQNWHNIWRHRVSRKVTTRDRVWKESTEWTVELKRTWPAHVNMCAMQRQQWMSSAFFHNRYLPSPHAIAAEKKHQLRTDSKTYGGFCPCSNWHTHRQRMRKGGTNQPHNHLRHHSFFAHCVTVEDHRGLWPQQTRCEWVSWQQRHVLPLRPFLRCSKEVTSMMLFFLMQLLPHSPSTPRKPTSDRNAHKRPVKRCRNGVLPSLSFVMYKWPTRSNVSSPRASKSGSSAPVSVVHCFNHGRSLRQVQSCCKAH